MGRMCPTSIIILTPQLPLGHTMHHKKRYTLCHDEDRTSCCGVSAPRYTVTIPDCQFINDTGAQGIRYKVKELIP
jgi:hypothetical protein